MTAHFVILWGLAWFWASVVVCALWAAWSLTVERHGGRA